jgi:hypothetical protein
MKAKQFAAMLVIALASATGSAVAAQSNRVPPQPQSPSASQPLIPSQPQSPSVYAPRKWEYRILTEPSWEYSKDSGIYNLQKDINQLAEQGFEIISIQLSAPLKNGNMVNGRDTFDGYIALVLLRREKN